MMCPGPELAAAYADGRLDAAEAARFIEHAAECDECRRTLAILSVEKESSAVPPALEGRVLRALHRSLGEQRERTPRPARFIVRDRATSAGWYAAAAAVLMAFVGVILLVRTREPRVAPLKTAVRAPEPETPQPAPKREAPEPREAVPPTPEAPRQVVIETPRKPEPPRPSEPPPEAPKEPVVREAPKFEETRPEESPRPPSHTIAARILTELQVTDLAGALTVRRKGGRDKERLSGVARLGEGDIVTAEKASSFQVEGRHPVVLSENTQVSVAYVAQEQAPFLHIRSGEAMVDSMGPTRWIVSDGRVAVVIKQARARFATVPGADRLAVTALTEPLYVEPDGGEVRLIRPGEEFHVGKASAEVRALDTALVARKSAAFEASRPRQRTVFYTSCDPGDAKREHFFIQDGAWFKNEALLSREKPDKTFTAALGPNPRFSWKEGLVVRFRYMTNAQALTVSFRVDERKYTLFKTLAVERKSANQWLSAEIPLIPTALQFRRDDGFNQLVISDKDSFDALRFTVRQQDVFGDQKAYFLVDDIQVVEKE